MKLLMGIAVVWALAGVPSIQWKSGLEQDLGTLEQGVPKTVDFVYVNEGTEPVLCDVVRTDCGCTVPEWAPVPVAPGKEGKIRVTYDAAKQGSFRKTIRVFFEGRKKPYLLRIRGDVE